MSKRPPPSCSSKVNVYLKLRGTISSPTIKKKKEQNVVTTIPPDGGPQKSYQFTEVFNEDVDHKTVFSTVARPLLDKLISSQKNGLIFTYGITGAGKTHTMEGQKGDGLVYRTFDYLFNSIGDYQTKKGAVAAQTGANGYQVNSPYYPDLVENHMQPSMVKWLANRVREEGKHESVDTSTQYCVFMTIVEFYLKELRDLLSTDQKQKLEVRTESYIARASQIEVKSADEAARYYREARSRRKTLKTSLNDASSRGHLVLILRLVRVRYNDLLDVSQLCLVDLAGSERTKLSGVSGSGLQETCSINNSLGTLRKCIQKLRENRPGGIIPYREDSLTMLFKSYFEGQGLVSMILCVKPEADNFKENQFAMEFGTQTSVVKVDYASPAKQLKRSRSKLGMLDVADMTFAELISSLKERSGASLERRKRDYETLQAAQKEVRVSICQLGDEVSALKGEIETRKSQLKAREHAIGTLEEQLNVMDDQNKELMDKNERKKRQIIELNAKIEAYYKTKLHRIHQGLSHVMTATPSAPMQSSSPIPTGSTECTESNSDPITNSSSGTIEFQRNPSPTNAKQYSPKTSSSGAGVPVINPKHNRSLSCSSLQWIHHKPKGTIDTGTVLRPKLKNGRSVRNLRSSDILRRDAGGYSVVHQDADTNGDVETRVYKGHILSTVCGGAQVILDDIETMRQVSPKVGRRRAASDVHYNF